MIQYCMIVRTRYNNTAPLPLQNAHALVQTMSHNSRSLVIPGLTIRCFQAGSVHTVPPPKLVRSSIDEDGSFIFSWSATGSSNKEQVYALSARGNLTHPDPNQRCFSVDCHCPSFAHQPAVDKVVPKVLCKHLHAALLSVVDDGKNNRQQESCGSENGGSTSQKKPAAASENEKKRIGVIDLSLDASDDESNCDTKQSSVAPTKRSSRSIEQKQQPARKKQATGNAAPLETPIKLFCTVQDDALRQKHDRSHWSWTQCRTLREMILGGTNDNEPIQWLVVANYIVDFGFVLQEVPELLSIPNVVVFYGTGSDPSGWQQVAQPNKVDFICLSPRGAPRTANNPLKYKFRAGTHHTKMFLVGRKESVRVVVHTANLTHCDVHLKAQAAYIEDFPKKTNGTTTNVSDFERTLVHYMESYSYGTQQSWLGDRQELLTESIGRYDFSTASGVLIPSIPSYNDIGATMPVGHLKLKQAVAQYTMNEKSAQSGTNSTNGPIICQFSSLGSISDNYLRQLQASMDTRLARLPYNPSDKSLIRLQFVYPTVSEIHNSIEGVEGGGSVPGQSKNVNKELIRNLLCKWSSTTTENNALTKPNNVPHIKTFYQVSKSLDSMEWFVLTSHNMSVPAWGRIQNSKYGPDGKCHYVESWELGVFLSPALLGVQKLVFWSEDNARPGSATIPMPYKMYLPDRYEKDDQPWAVDGPGALM